ncbi:MAG: site-specific integrase [Acidimicrobiales bacterium]|jgi:integrase|nr:site-specific integrase [Acidimicrobiales bacterium]
MTAQATDPPTRPDRRRLPSRKVVPLPIDGLSGPDSIEAWAGRYLDAAVRGVRSAEVTDKIALHLARFRDHVQDAHGHERLSAVVRREVLGWREYLAGNPDAAGLGLAPATVNAYLASLSGFMTWVVAHEPAVLPHGNPCAKVADLPLPPLEPRALTDAQVWSLKNVLDRLERFHQHKGRRRRGGGELHAHARPLRDRAIVYVLLATGLRREELVRLNLTQISPNTSEALRAAKKAKISDVRGKGRTSRHLYLSADARAALADYLQHERPRDTGDEQASALFLSAASIGSRRADGRLSPRAVNLICEQIGRWHDAEHPEPTRHLSPLRPHDLRHSFAYRLSTQTNHDAYELQRRLGHQSQRYIQRYTNPPEHIAAGYIENL